MCDVFGVMVFQKLLRMERGLELVRCLFAGEPGRRSGYLDAFAAVYG